LFVAITIKLYGEVVESTRPQSILQKRKADGTIDGGNASKAPRTADAGIAGLFADKALADVSIIMADKRRLQAHKLILSMRSVVIKSMFSSRMSESTSNQIVMDDYTPGAVRAFIEYLYKESLPASCDANTLAELLGMAHKYQVGRLEDDCTERLAADITPSSVLDVLQLAELYSSDRLRAAAYGVLRGRGRETVKEAGFFERLEAYWAACAPATVVVSSGGASSSSSCNAVSNGKKMGVAGGEGSSSAVAAASAAVMGKKGGKAGKSSKSSATAASKAVSAVTAVPSSAAVKELDPTPTLAPTPAVRIPDEIREVIRALSENSAPRGDPPHTAVTGVSSATAPPCLCRICRMSRGEVVAAYPDEYAADANTYDEGASYGDDYGEDEVMDDDDSQVGDY
jgi:hypothetical protein